MEKEVLFLLSKCSASVSSTLLCFVTLVCLRRYCCCDVTTVDLCNLCHPHGLHSRDSVQVRVTHTISQTSRDSVQVSVTHTVSQTSRDSVVAVATVMLTLGDFVSNVL